MLKLWGRVMARLYWEEDLGLAWAPVYIEDFVQSRSNPADIPFILEKIRENYSAGKLFMVLYNETAGQVRGIVKSNSGENLKKVAEALGAKIEGEICEFFDQADDTAQAGQHAVEKIRTHFAVQE